MTFQMLELLHFLTLLVLKLGHASCLLCKGNLTKRQGRGGGCLLVLLQLQMPSLISHIVKELKMKKMEMTKFIKSQLLQIEKNGKHMIVQGQLQMNAFFGTMLKAWTANGSGGSDNW